MNKEPKVVDLDAIRYIPLIQGKSSELLNIIERYKEKFPNLSKLLSRILLSNFDKYPSLEDWLIIPFFQFFYSDKKEALQYLENLYAKAQENFKPDSFSKWCKEVEVQAKCVSLNALCNRLYDYHLQLLGGLYLINRGYTPELISNTDEGSTPDFCVGEKNNRTHVLEAKFIHTSDKRMSFIRRFHKAIRLYSVGAPIIIFETLSAPSSHDIKTLDNEECLTCKKFMQIIYEAPQCPCIGYSKKRKFSYHPQLSSSLVPINSQKDFIKKIGKEFIEKRLKSLLKKGEAQMNSEEFIKSNKILFIGIQLDPIYLGPWTEESWEMVKGYAKNTNSCEVIFSEDVGFSVKRYI